jgi:hypothetical protein
VKCIVDGKQLPKRQRHCPPTSTAGEHKRAVDVE